MHNPFSLQNKKILVTGASSGIGRATAIECSKMGARLIITGRNAGRLEEVFSCLEGTDHQMIIADLTRQAELEKVVNESDDLSGVVFSAGATMLRPFQFCSSDKVRSIMEINFFSATELCHLLVKNRKLHQSGSSLVFISSVSGIRASAPGLSIYSASKGAIDGLIKGIAFDLAPRKIRVNSILPGMIETDLLFGDDVTKEQLEENLEQKYLLKRYGRPEEVAYGAVYLLSDASAWVTGSSLLIDGGRTLI